MESEKGQLIQGTLAGAFFFPVGRFRLGSSTLINPRADLGYTVGATHKPFVILGVRCQLYHTSLLNKGYALVQNSTGVELVGKNQVSY